jgi:hypothetical protein
MIARRIDRGTKIGNEWERISCGDLSGGRGGTAVLVRRRKRRVR